MPIACTLYIILTTDSGVSTVWTHTQTSSSCKDLYGVLKSDFETWIYKEMNKFRI